MLFYTFSQRGWLVGCRLVGWLSVVGLVGRIVGELVTLFSHQYVYNSLASKSRQDSNLSLNRRTLKHSVVGVRT